MNRMELYKAGKTDEEIAEITGVKLKTVREWRYRYHLPNNEPKETVFDREKAIQLWNDGLSDRQIAQMLGCSHGAISSWREYNELEPNGFIFSWQTKLKPSEFAKIPEKYRNPKLEKVG